NLQGTQTMGLAAYEIIGNDAEWRVRHDGKAENTYETKEAAFEAAVAAASLALRQGHEIRVTAPARVLIGTSGWHYDSWRGPFFPKGLPLKAQLQFYASQFSSAELNGVFYRTPTPKAV